MGESWEVIGMAVAEMHAFEDGTSGLMAKPPSISFSTLVETVTAFMPRLFSGTHSSPYQSSGGGGNRL
jgi:hypothetical protein